MDPWRPDEGTDRASEPEALEGASGPTDPDPGQPAAWEAVEPPAVPPSAWEPVGPPATSRPPGARGGWTAPPGWVAPPGSGPRSPLATIAIVGGAVVALVVVAGVSAVAALTFLGSQVDRILAGTVEFGTAGNACVIDRPASSFPIGQEIHAAGHLDRSLAAGEQLTLRLTTSGSEVGRDQKTFGAAASCVWLDLPTSNLSAGTYRLEYDAGSQVLAAGSFTLTP